MSNSSDINKGKKIGLGTAIVIGINAMIGGGIISVPLVLANTTGPAGILTFLFSMVVVILIGISLGRVAQLYPGDGWNYLYPATWGGHKLGLVSALSYTAGAIVALGFLVQQAGLYSQYFFPSLDQKFLGTLILAILTALIIGGTQVSALGQYVIIACVVLPLVSTAIICWSHLDISLATPFMPYGPSSIISAAPAVIFGFLGFESIASLYAIVKNPRKNVSKACIIAVIIVSLFYLFFSAGILFSIPSAQLSGGVDQTLSSAVRATFPNIGFLPILISIGALFAIIGTIHSMIWSINVLLMSVLKRIKSKYVIRAISRNWINYKNLVLLISILILILSLIVKGDLLLYMTIFLMVPSLVLSIAALLFVKEEWSSKNNILTLFALAGGILLIYYASKPLSMIILN